MKKLTVHFKSGRVARFGLSDTQTKELQMAIMKTVGPVQFMVFDEILINGAEVEYIEVEGV